MAGPRRWRLTFDGNQSVTFVELFFDLVFVFAVTQIAAVLAADLDLANVARSVLLFWIIWWAWTQFTWTLNPADTTHGAIRLATLVATAIAFIMAAAVPEAFGADGIWFALSYVAMRGLGLAIQLLVALEQPAVDHAGERRWLAGSMVGLVLVVVGAIADPNLRPFIWAAAVLADLLAAALAGAGRWELQPAHFAERHGLFVIIALGETMIIAGAEFAAEDRSGSLVAAGIATLLVACLMWWDYFAWLKEAMEEAFARAGLAVRGRLARDAYSLAHFPLVGGIVAFAVVLKEVLHYPDTPLPLEILAMLGIGIALYSGSGALAYWRLTGRPLVGRLLIALGLVLATPLMTTLPPIWPLLLAAAALFAIALLERRRDVPETSEVSDGLAPLSD